MKKVELFEHNEQAYTKLCQSLKTSNCTTINHATGTGKSFIALKYMYENRNKRILYIAPTYPIIEQLKGDYSKIGLSQEDLKIDTMIYRSLLDMDVSDIYDKYDIIIFDEYHRTGAPETYKKIKQIKQLLQEKTKNGEDKKLIGLTATPIRYLDSERNMTQEIFDGNVASTISLSEAMLRGLLPIPQYINSKVACRKELDKARKKVKRMGESEEKKTIEEDIAKIDRKINNGETDIRKILENNIVEKDGKYIVFCNTIKDLERLLDVSDVWFKSFGNVNKYVVHSKQTKENNQNELNKFNNAKDGINLLFCVDILNEGVHVDNIDGVLLFRKTVSPIIYFQQIGRTLSFSGRNKQIKIFDFVNNFGNHDAIYEIFKEFKSEMQRLIQEHPERKNEYLEKLNRFKIMDETKEIYSEIEKILSKLTHDVIIKSRLKEAVNELVKTPDMRLIFSDKKLKEKYMLIRNYYRYITNEQFKKMLDANLILPTDLFMTIEEREQLLKGYDSFYELEKNYTKVFAQELITYINEKRKIPDLNSEDENERKLASEYLELLPNFSKNIIDDIKLKIKEFNIPCQSYEKIFFNMRLQLRDIDDLIKRANKYIQNNEILPEYLRIAVENTLYRYTCSRSELLFKILEINDKLIKEKKSIEEQARAQELMEIIDFLNENPNISIEELKEKGLLDKINSLSKKDKEFIQSKFKTLKKNQLMNLLKGKKYLDLDFLCTNAKNMDENAIRVCIENLKYEVQKSENILKVIKFVKKHKRLPEPNSSDEEEQKIAIEFENYILNGDINGLIKRECFSFQNELYTPIDATTEILYKYQENLEIQRILLDYMMYFVKNGHRPLENSNDEDEMKLAQDYKKYCIPKLGEHRITTINRFFNSKKSISSTIRQYLKNKTKEENQDK